MQNEATIMAYTELLSRDNDFIWLLTNEFGLVESTAASAAAAAAFGARISMTDNSLAYSTPR